jgi:hypothetical protein
MVFKTFTGRTAKLWVIDQSQLLELQDINKRRGILIENRCIDWSPAHFCGNYKTL